MVRICDFIRVMQSGESITIWLPRRYENQKFNFYYTYNIFYNKIDFDPTGLSSVMRIRNITLNIISVKL